MSAVVMGCFVPDYAHFISLSPDTALGHSIPGMFVMDLPLAMAALWVYHAFIRQPLLLFLPDGIRRRLATGENAFRWRPWKRFALTAISVLIGIATHLVWDAFTHGNSWICRHWAFLRSAVELPVAGQMQMCKLLEYASSVFGVAVLGVWIGHWYRTTPPSATPGARPVAGWVAVVPVLATLGGALRAWLRNGVALEIRPIVHFTADTLISAITFFLVGLLVCGMVLRLRRAVPA